jgi:hypothetical protein
VKSISMRHPDLVLVLLLLLWTLGAALAGCRGPQSTAARGVSGAILAPTVPAAPDTAATTIATVAAPGETPAIPSYWPTQGWRTSTPAEQGMDAAKLAQMLDSVQQRNLNLHSLLVIRNGTIVSETYFGSSTPRPGARSTPSPRASSPRSWALP